LAMSSRGRTKRKRLIGQLFTAAREYRRTGFPDRADDCEAHARAISARDGLYETPWGRMTRGQLRTILCEAQNHRCCYCGVDMTEHPRERSSTWLETDATVEHLEPKCRQGGNTWDNTVAACFKCNSNRPTGLPAIIYFEHRETIYKIMRRRKNAASRRRYRGKSKPPPAMIAVGGVAMQLL
jgi:5-methylcytosine-specific restriction endonuclease McrA